MSCCLSVSLAIQIQETMLSTLHRFEHLPKQEGLDGVKSTREIKQHRFHPDSKLLLVGITPVELVYDSIVCTFDS